MQNLLRDIRDKFPFDAWKGSETWDKIQRNKGQHEVIDFIYDRLGIMTSPKVVTAPRE